MLRALLEALALLVAVAVVALWNWWLWFRYRPWVNRRSRLNETDDPDAG